MTAAHNRGIGTIYATVIDVNDLETSGAFWSQLLGVDVLYQNDNYFRLGRQGELPYLLLQRVPDPQQGKNRVHLDLEVPDLQAAVNRAQELGAHQLQAVSEDSVEWVVMTDPDGNEFCLVKHR
ncbi:VOC family protein [Candidatus Entotheonella palauensis]|nr:VOC family protein [Candidatus Entotheonella palauensis]